MHLNAYVNSVVATLTRYSVSTVSRVANLVAYISGLVSACKSQELVGALANIYSFK
jgi:hypothetical protein